MISVCIFLLSFGAIECSHSLTIRDTIDFLVEFNEISSKSITSNNEISSKSITLNDLIITVNDKDISYGSVAAILGMVCENTHGYLDESIAQDKAHPINEACDFLAATTADYIRQLSTSKKLPRYGLSASLSGFKARIGSWKIEFVQVETMFPISCKVARDGGYERKEHEKGINSVCEGMQKDAEWLLQEIGWNGKNNQNVLRDRLSKTYHNEDKSIVVYSQIKIMVPRICEHALFHTQDYTDPNALSIQVGCFALYHETFGMLVDIGTLIYNGKSEESMDATVRTYANEQALIALDQARPFMVNICEKVEKNEKHNVFIVHTKYAFEANYDYAKLACEYLLLSHLELLAGESSMAGSSH